MTEPPPTCPHTNEILKQIETIRRTMDMYLDALAGEVMEMKVKNEELRAWGKAMEKEVQDGHR